MAIVRFIARRLFLLLFILLGITIIIFFMSRIVPQDPAVLYIGPHAKPEQVVMIREKLGLDKPAIVQYGIYLKDLVRGDWGISFRTKRSVIKDVFGFLPNSLELILTSIFLSMLIGIPAGVISAVKKKSLFDHIGRVISIGGVSIPSFWLALLLQILFVRQLGLLPVGARLSTAVSVMYPVKHITGFMFTDAVLTGNWIAFKDLVIHAIMPVITLAAYPVGAFTRMIRSTMIEVLSQDYIRTANAYSINKKYTIFIYALKNAFGPTLTVIGLTFAYSLIGAFFVELIFSWPGIGTYACNAILSMDYPAVLGVTIVITFLYVFTNVLVDLLQAILDPRISLSKAGDF